MTSAERVKTGQSKKCVILGAGGHAKVVIDALRASDQSIEIMGALDADSSLWNQSILDIPILGGDEKISEMSRDGVVTHFVMGLGGVGNNEPRQRLFKLGKESGLKPLSVWHPSAIVSSSAKVGEGSVLMARCVVQAEANIGVNVIVNTSAIIEHDCQIGDHAHIATGAALAAAVIVGEGAHVGVNATVRQGVTIGERAIVGAGAVVVRDVPAHTTVAGSPATSLDRIRQREDWKEEVSQA